MGRKRHKIILQTAVTWGQDAISRNQIPHVVIIVACVGCGELVESDIIEAIREFLQAHREEEE